MLKIIFVLFILFALGEAARGVFLKKENYCEYGTYYVPLAPRGRIIMECRYYNVTVTASTIDGVSPVMLYVDNISVYNKSGEAQISQGQTVQYYFDNKTYANTCNRLYCNGGRTMRVENADFFYDATAYERCIYYILLYNPNEYPVTVEYTTDNGLNKYRTIPDLIVDPATITMFIILFMSIMIFMQCCIFNDRSKLSSLQQSFDMFRMGYNRSTPVNAATSLNRQDSKRIHDLEDNVGTITEALERVVEAMGNLTCEIRHKQTGEHASANANEIEDFHVVDQ
jgi:hypothetical protein